VVLLSGAAEGQFAPLEIARATGAV